MHPSRPGDTPSRARSGSPADAGEPSRRASDGRAPRATAAVGAAALEAPVRAALRLLGKRNVLLIVHDASFPFAPGEDLAHGSPFSRASTGFLEYVATLGFTGIQLGPRGRTSAANPSPYDSSWFSRNERTIALGDLVDGEALGGLLGADTLRRLGDAAEASGERARHDARIRALHAQALAEAFATFRRLRGARPEHPLAVGFARFTAEQSAWLEADALYAVLARAAHGAHHTQWPDAIDRHLLAPAPDQALAAARRIGFLRRLYADALERYAFEQFLLARQHAALRARLGALGLETFGDLQIGMGPCDEWRLQRWFLRGYRLGAPPSRTNPEGQPWGYPVVDPRHLEGPEAPWLGVFRDRLLALSAEHDGLRIDHPHGLVCPWVYSDAALDPFAAVRAGARLFESPDEPDHPRLAAFARVRREQISADPALPGYADGRVLWLAEEQLERYGTLLREVTAAWGGRGAADERLACEVLSTQPYPLARVVERLGLGRFRVTQKADPDDPADVYRSSTAGERDWVMVGNHDTPSFWRLARGLRGAQRGVREALYLAARLSGRSDAELAERLANDVSALVHAKLSDAFASPARNVMVCFTDLFGLEDDYNAPGTVGPQNWTLRVPADWRSHAERAGRGEALDMGRVLAGALRMRGAARDPAHAALIARLERRA